MLDQDVYLMNRKTLQGQVIKLRTAIRTHRNQRGDDRCWMDDYDLYDSLPEKAAYGVDLRQLPREQMMKNCEQYTLARSVTSTPEAALELYRLRKAEQ